MESETRKWNRDKERYVRTCVNKSETHFIFITHDRGRQDQEKTVDYQAMFEPRHVFSRFDWTGSKERLVYSDCKR